jgi:hypothetical protein
MSRNHSYITNIHDKGMLIGIQTFAVLARFSELYHSVPIRIIIISVDNYYYYLFLI